MLTDYNKINISSVIVTYIYKILLIPFYLLLFSTIALGFIFDKAIKSFPEVIIILVLILSILIAGYILIRLKYISAGDKGLKYNETKVPWQSIHKVYLCPFMSPLPIMIVYKKNNKRKIVFSTMPYLKFDEAENFLKKNLNSKQMRGGVNPIDK